MARTPSTMLPLDTPLPAFRLPDTTADRSVSSADFAGRPLVVAFICNHCPFVKHIRAELARFGKFCDQNGVAMVAISSNDVAGYPDDSPEHMAKEAREAGYTFAYLYDESQSVARAFDAACTPDFYLFDGQGRLSYRGQFDDSRPGNGIEVTGRDLRAAVDALVRGARPSQEQKASIGCNIKWKAGNAPG
ncbi:MAG: thioredoxin family protein [Polyangiaceae bacterium]